MKSVNVKRTYEKPKCKTIQIEMSSVIASSPITGIEDEKDTEIGTSQK